MTELETFARSCTATAIVLLLSACMTTPSERAQRVAEADEQMVQGCAYLGEVDGSSVLTGAGGANAGRNNARNEARDQAAGMGATHVVWRGAESGYLASTASGRDYRCGQ